MKNPQAVDDKATEAKPETFTRRQRNALASCYWMPCPTCAANVPVLRGVGCPALGFRKWHKPTCDEA